MKPIEQPEPVQSTRPAALRGFAAGISVTVLIGAIAAIGYTTLANELAEKFREGAFTGFCIGVGMMVGLVALNVVIGLLDRFSNDATH